MYIQQHPANENSLEKSLEQAREMDCPFILDLSHLTSLKSSLIRDLVETCTLKSKNLYLLIPPGSRLLDIFQRESLLGILPVFNRLKDIERIVFQKSTPCYYGYFPGKLFDIPAQHQDDLNRAVEASSKNGESGLSWDLREEFQKQGFSLPARLAVMKENEDWLICEYKEKRTSTQDKGKVLYLLRMDVYGRSLEVCHRMLTLSLYGTLQGEELASQFGLVLKSEASPLIFIDLNQCYSWDNNYANCFKKAKEWKKLYLVRSDIHSADSLFKLKGDIFYCDYEKAYEKARLVLQKRWEITPNPSIEKKESCLLEINGYLVDQKEEFKQFKKRLFSSIQKILKKFHWVALDIRELYRMENKARKAFLHALRKWITRYKIKKFHLIIIATLPRNDYIVHDLTSDLYNEGFFIVPTWEEAKEIHNSYPHPHFILENSLNTSLMTMKGNVIHNQEKRIFKQEIQGMFKNSLSLCSGSSNIIQSPHRIVFFDFLSAPCVYLDLIETIIEAEQESKKLTKILLVNQHVQELVKKLLSKYDNVLCYDNKEKACLQHIKNVLIVLPLRVKKEAREYFQQIFEEIYQIKEAKNTQFCIRFNCAFERIPSILSSEHYNLIILYGCLPEEQNEAWRDVLKKQEKNVLELKPHQKEWMELLPQQMELDQHIAVVKEKIIAMLWNKEQEQAPKRYLFSGSQAEKISHEVLLPCLQENEIEFLSRFLPVVDDTRYEIILTYNRGKAFSFLPQSMDKKGLVKLEFHPYRQWARNFCFYYGTSSLEIIQKTANETDISNTFSLLEKYTGTTIKIWDLIPNKIKKCLDYRWLSFLTAQNKFLVSVFKSKIFEIQYILLFLQKEIEEIFLSYLWTVLSYLKEEFIQDLRYQGIELPFMAFLKTLYTFANNQNSKNNSLWIMASMEFLENEGLEILINIENLASLSDFPATLRQELEDLRSLYKIDMEMEMGKDNSTFQIKMILKKLQKRVITFKKE